MSEDKFIKSYDEETGDIRYTPNPKHETEFSALVKRVEALEEIVSQSEEDNIGSDIPGVK